MRPEPLELFNLLSAAEIVILRGQQPGWALPPGTYKRWERMREAREAEARLARERRTEPKEQAA